MSRRQWIWHNRWRILALVLVTAALALWTPPNVPLCGFRRLTGRPCPLCGLTRALFALAKGHVREAFALHALSPIAAVALAGTVLRRDPPWGVLVALFGAYGLLRIVAGIN